MVELICFGTGLFFLAFFILVYRVIQLSGRINSAQEFFLEKFSDLNAELRIAREQITHLQNKTSQILTEQEKHSSTGEPVKENIVFRKNEHHDSEPTIQEQPDQSYYLPFLDLPLREELPEIPNEPPVQAVETGEENSALYLESTFESHAEEFEGSEDSGETDTITAEYELWGTPEHSVSEPEEVSADSDTITGEFEITGSFQVEPQPKEVEPVTKFSHIKEEKDAVLRLEVLIGRKALGWIAALLFVLFAVYFIHYVSVRNLVPPAARLACLGVLGGAFLVSGWYHFSIGWKRFASMLNASGIMILFLSGYASYGYFRLLSESPAMFLMSVIVLGSFVLAYVYRSVLLGTLSIIGGLAVPMLLSSENDLYIALFSYLFLLNLGTLLLLNLLSRVPLGLLVMAGTQAEFLIWFNGNYEPDKMFYALLFQGTLYAIYLIDTTIGTFSNRFRTGWDDTVRAILAPILMFAWFFIIMRKTDVDNEVTGRFAFCGTLWYAMLGMIYIGAVRGRGLFKTLKNRAENAPPLHGAAIMIPVTTIISFSFLAIGIPMTLGAPWISLGWITVASLLWVIGNRIESNEFRRMGYVFFTLGLSRIMLLDLPVREELRFPLVNIYAAPIFACAVLILIVVSITGKTIREKASVLLGGKPWWRNETEAEKKPLSFLEMRRNINITLGLIALVISIVILSIETFHAFRLNFPINGFALGTWSLSLLWLLLGAAVFRFGIRNKNTLAKFSGGTLVGFGTLKVFLFDIPSRFIVENPITVTNIGTFDWISDGSLSVPVFNTYAIPLILFACFACLFGYFASKMKDMNSVQETDSGRILLLSGILIFWAVLSIECASGFYHSAIVNSELLACWSLSVLWLLLGTICYFSGRSLDEFSIRIFARILFAFAGLKVLGFDLWSRIGSFSASFGLETVVPGSLDWPLLNAYAIPILITGLGLSAIGVYETKDGKIHELPNRLFGRSMIGCGSAIICVLLSIECCHQIVLRVETNAIPSAFSMLSILWFMIGLGYVFIGLKLNSRSVRLFGGGLISLAGIKAITVDLEGRFLAFGEGEILKIFDFAHDSLLVPIFNSYAIPILCLSIGFLVFGNIIYRNRNKFASFEQELGPIMVGGGMLQLWLVVSVECVYYFLQRNSIPDHVFHSHSSLSVLWLLFIIVFAVIGLFRRSNLICGFAICISLIAELKVILLELISGPQVISYDYPILNLYALPIIVLLTFTIPGGIAFSRSDRITLPVLKNIGKGVTFLGLTILWILLSIECYNYFCRDFSPIAELSETCKRHVGVLSLGGLWTVFAMLLYVIGVKQSSRTIRFFSILVFAFLLLKTVLFDLRMQGNAIGYPVLNTYFVPLFFVTISLIVFALLRSVKKERSETFERNFFIFSGYAALFLLWAGSSLECYYSLEPEKKAEDAIQLAHLGLSILWAAFAGLMLLFGFILRQSMLRWSAILLLGVTVLKLFFVDLSSLDNVYKIGAILPLAIVLFLAARAYQKFVPE